MGSYTEHAIRVRAWQRMMMVASHTTNNPEEIDIRLHGLEFALEESVPQLVGALVMHLASKGMINLSEFEGDLRAQFNPDLRTEDSTGAMFANLANLVSLNCKDTSGPA